MSTTPAELVHALSLMRRAREACAARLEYTKAVWRIERPDMMTTASPIVTTPVVLAAAAR